MKKCMFVLLGLLAGPVFSQQFTSPRANAISAYVAISDDNFGLNWNTAGLAFGEHVFTVDFIARDHSKSISDLGAKVRLWDRHTFAVRKTPLVSMDTGFSRFPRPQTREEVTPLDLLGFILHRQDFEIGYAFRFNRKLALGVDSKRHVFSNDLFSSSRFWGFTFSAAYQFSDRLRLGLISRNSFTHHYREHFNRIAFRTAIDAEPKVFAIDYDAIPGVYTEPEWRLELGTAYRPFQPLLLAGDVFTDGSFGLGMEWQFVRNLFLRQGFQKRFNGINKEIMVTSYSLGMGINLWQARVDFSWNPWVKNEDDYRVTTTDGIIAIPAGREKYFVISALFVVR